MWTCGYYLEEQPQPEWGNILISAPTWIDPCSYLDMWAWWAPSSPVLRGNLQKNRRKEEDERWGQGEKGVQEFEQD